MPDENVSALEKASFKIVMYSVAFGVSLAEFWILMTAFFYAWFGIGIAGLFLITLRAVFIELIPHMLHAAKFWTGVTNAFLDAFGIVENGAIVVIDAVMSIVGFFSGKLHPIHPQKFGHISINQFKTELTLISRQCPPVDSTYAIAREFLPPFISDSLCPVYRALWPLPYDISKKLYEPLSLVVADPTPYPGNNCDRNSTPEYNVVCAGLAVGYPVLEVLLPTVIFGVFILSSGGPLSSLVYEFVVFAWSLAKEVGRISSDLIRAVKTVLTGVLNLIGMLARKHNRLPSIRT